MAPRWLRPPLWLAVLVLCAAAPLLFFIGGASDSATDADRFRIAAVPLVVAWLPLTVALSGRPWAWARALALLALAAGLALLANVFANGPALSGDTEWSVFWLAALAVWAAAARLALRAPRGPRPRA
jgi:hypothetical protein